MNGPRLHVFRSRLDGSNFGVHRRSHLGKNPVRLDSSVQAAKMFLHFNVGVHVCRSPNMVCSLFWRSRAAAGAVVTSRCCPKAMRRSVSPSSSKRRSATKRRCAVSTPAATRSRDSISFTVGSRSRRRSRTSTPRRRSMAASSTSTRLVRSCIGRPPGLNPSSTCRRIRRRSGRSRRSSTILTRSGSSTSGRSASSHSKASVTARLRTPRGTFAATARRTATASPPAAPRFLERSTRVVAAVPRSKRIA